MINGGASNPAEGYAAPLHSNVTSLTKRIIQRGNGAIFAEFFDYCGIGCQLKMGVLNRKLYCLSEKTIKAVPLKSVRVVKPLD